MSEKKPWWFFAQIALTLLFLFPIWWLPYLPLNDLPNHMASMHLLAKYDAGIQTYVVPNPEVFVPNSSVFVLMRFLTPFTGVDFAARLILSIYIIALPISLAYFLKKFSPGAEPLSLVAFPFMYNWIFMMGFLNNALAFPLFLFAAGFWFSLRGRNDASFVNLAIFWLLSILLFFTHISAFLPLAALAFFMRATGKDRDMLLFDAICLLPGILLTLFFAFQSVPSDMNHIVWGYFLRKLSYFITMLPNPALMLIFSIVLACYFAISSLSGQIRIKTDSKPNSLFLLAAILFAVYFFLPENLPTWQFAGARLVPFVLFFAFASFAATLASSSPRLTNEFAAAFAIVAIASFLFSFASMNEDSALLSQNARIASFLGQNSSIFPVGDGFAKAGAAATSPLFHSWGYFVIQKDVFSPYLFSESYTPVKYSDEYGHGRGPINGWLAELSYRVFTSEKDFEGGCDSWNAHYGQINWSLISENYDYVLLRTATCKNITVPCPYYQFGEVNGTKIFRRALAQ